MNLEQSGTETLGNLKSLKENWHLLLFILFILEVCMHFDSLPSHFRYTVGKTFYITPET